jgi:hypothetical protein
MYVCYHFNGRLADNTVYCQRPTPRNLTVIRKITPTQYHLNRLIASPQTPLDPSASTGVINQDAVTKELMPRRVNVVSPGITVTEAYDALSAEQRQAMFTKAGSGLPVGRVGQAAEVAAGYLLAMENGFIAGSVIDIDGGGLL